MRAAGILYAYAVFIAACALTAFAMAPDKSNAKTALIFGGVAALLVAVCGVMAGLIHRQRTVGMIGIHVGLVLPILYLIEFGRRAWMNFAGDEPKAYLAWIFSILAAGSLVAFIMLLRARPKPAERK